MSRDRGAKAGLLPTARTLILVLSAALAFSGAHSWSQERTSEPHPPQTRVAQPTLAELEDVFWVCDHAATTHGVLDLDRAAMCAAYTRDLRRRKFNGDFNALLAWWRLNKPYQHQLLDMRDRAAAHR